jgi:hypothetical protein
MMRTRIARVRTWARRGLKTLVRLTLLLILLGALGDGDGGDTSLGARVTALARPDLFDYVTWETGALWGKAQQQVFGVQDYLDDADGHALVINYLTRLSDVQDLEDTIERAYADPRVADPAVATAELRSKRDALRRDLAADQPLAEAIIESQVSAVLLDEGFGVLGQVLPPVSMHFTAIPELLVVSPRDRIAFDVSLDLNPIPVEERDALEARLDSTLDVSSLVVPLGGLSLYPSMILEPSSRDVSAKVARAFEVTAHEWSHHYLVFYALGWEYNLRTETRIINETTATFFGRAVAQRVMARYYPELTPPVYPSFLTAPAPSSPATAAPAPDNPACCDPDAPPAFDFSSALNSTRVEVDFLLWQGNIDAAEAYMRARQREFARHGYIIRKLNQAYFAFYGGYQGEPGAGGTDPIGPAIETLLARRPTLEAYLQTMRHITTREQLLAAAE